MYIVYVLSMLTRLTLDTIHLLSDRIFSIILCYRLIIIIIFILLCFTYLLMNNYLLKRPMSLLQRKKFYIHVFLEAILLFLF